MNRLAMDILGIADDILRRITIGIPREADIGDAVYGEIHYETQRFLDRLRRNEGIDTFMNRIDTTAAMTIEVGFTDHEEREAIVRELIAVVSKVSARKGIKEVWAE